MGKYARFSPGLRGRKRVSKGRGVLPHQEINNSKVMEDNLERHCFWRN
jgi:hypothetical protein